MCLCCIDCDLDAMLRQLSVCLIIGVVGRAEVMSAALLLAAYCIFARLRLSASLPWTQFAAVWLLVTASFLSKETGITVLGVMLLHDMLIARQAKPAAS